MAEVIDEQEDECRHGLGPISACVICNGKARTQERAKSTTVRFFEARYIGFCGDCRSPIDLGDTIAERGDGRYICQECAT